MDYKSGALRMYEKFLSLKSDRVTHSEWALLIQ